MHHEKVLSNSVLLCIHKHSHSLVWQRPLSVSKHIIIFFVLFYVCFHQRPLHFFHKRYQFLFLSHDAIFQCVHIHLSSSNLWLSKHSIKLLCVYLCLSFRDIFISSISFLFLFIPIFCYPYFSTFIFHLNSIKGFWVVFCPSLTYFNLAPIDQFLFNLKIINLLVLKIQ